MPFDGIRTVLRHIYYYVLKSNPYCFLIHNGLYDVIQHECLQIASMLYISVNIIFKNHYMLIVKYINFET